jgi:hypothetical protein
MKQKLLFVTDLYYESKGRVYYEEDMFLSSRLSESFDLVLCNPRVAIAFMPNVDVILFRNTGPILCFSEEYDAFKKEALATRAKVFNELSGKADMKGKQYLIDLTRDGCPVIPSVDNKNEFDRLPVVKNYLAKPIHGADSIGIEFFTANELETIDVTDKLIQPVMEFLYEVSFYFINHDFQYALYAPKPDKRWDLEEYDATESDIEYALKFVEWNDINYGIQRIDACRMPNGELFLMEIEDLNPYLSLDLLPNEIREKFVENLAKSLVVFVNK